MQLTQSGQILYQSYLNQITHLLHFTDAHYGSHASNSMYHPMKMTIGTQNYGSVTQLLFMLLAIRLAEKGHNRIHHIIKYIHDKK